MGLIGQIAVQILKASGVRVLGFDPNPARCLLALECGADEALSENLLESGKVFTNGYGFDSVLITAATQSNEPVTQAGELARHKGKIVAAGLVNMDLPRDQYYKKELDFRLSTSYGPGRYDSAYEEQGRDYPYGYVRWTEQRNMQAYLQLIASGQVNIDRLITHYFPFEKALDAYDLLSGKAKEDYLGIVLQYSQEEEKSLLKLSDKVSVSKENKVLRQYGDNPLGVGWIGTGQFAQAVLLPQLIKQKNAKPLMVASQRGMSSALAAKKFGFESATTNVTSILDEQQVDVVFITTRHNTHAPFVVAALEAGKHVFVEKPLALNHDELSQVKKAYHASDAKLLVGFNRRFSPHTLMIQDYFSKRKTPLLIHYRVNAGKISKEHWTQDKEIGGGRIIGEVCHFVDFVSALVGSDPVRVSANTTQLSTDMIEDCAIQLVYQDGSVANIQYFTTGPVEMPKEFCEIFCEGSTAVLDDFKLTTCFGALGNKKKSGKQLKGFAEELELFFDAIKGNLKEPIAFESLCKTTECCFAILDSIKKQKTVELNVSEISS